MNEPVARMKAARTHIVGWTRHTRKPYSNVMLTQMKWNGTVSHVANRSMATRFTAANTAHAASSQFTRFSGHSTRSGRIQAVPLAPDRLDHVRAELAAQTSDVDVDHVRTGVEVVAPHRREQAFLGHRLAGAAHQLLEQQELPLGQRDPPRPGVGLPPDQVERQAPGGDPGRGRLGGLAEA